MSALGSAALLALAAALVTLLAPALVIAALVLLRSREPVHPPHPTGGPPMAHDPDRAPRAPVFDLAVPLHFARTAEAIAPHLPEEWALEEVGLTCGGRLVFASVGSEARGISLRGIVPYDLATPDAIAAAVVTVYRDQTDPEIRRFWGLDDAADEDRDEALREEASRRMRDTRFDA